MRRWAHASSARPPTEQRKINGVPAETVGARAHDCRGGTVAWDGRASCPQGANCVDEKAHGQDRHRRAGWCTERSWDEPYWPKQMKHQAEYD